MKLLHAADLHIDSPMRGLTRYEGAPIEQLRISTRRAVEALVERAIAESVDVVTIGGDVFDGDWRDVNTGLWWIQQLDRLTSAAIEVYVVHGNHDAESQLTHRLPSPPGVHVFGSDQPETIESADLPIAIHGQSYRDRAEPRDLASMFPQPIPGVFNVGLLHTSLDGRPLHAPYAPCSTTTLERRGYGLWALGHVHTREVIVLGDTVALFPGNTQGRNIREAGPKGASIVHFDDGRVTSVDAVELDVARWELLRIDVAECAGLSDIASTVASVASAARAEAGRPLAVRIELTGATRAHADIIRRSGVLRGEILATIAIADRDVWVEKVIDRTRRLDDVGAANSDAVDAIRRIVSRAEDDASMIDEIAGHLEEFDAKVASALRRLGDPDRPLPSEREELRRRLPIIADQLIARLEER